MNQKSKLFLDGRNLTIANLYQTAKNPEIRIELAETAKKQIHSSHNFLQTTLKNNGGIIIYGINTGFGPMASHILAPDQLLALQQNLIYSHAVGMGEPIPEAFVLASMLVRLNTLAKGCSGVSLELAEQLARLINHRIIPIVPEHGAVGTSGDLVQLAHIALAVVGQGEVIYKRRRQSASKIFKHLGIRPYKLKAKEGLALINGTSVMSGIAGLLWVESKKLLDVAVRCGAFGLELTNGFDDSISKQLHNMRPHAGQIKIGQTMRTLLKDSRMLRNRRKLRLAGPIKHPVEEIPASVQEVYSFRCVAQILGPMAETLTKTRGEIEIEINSATDNPLVDVKGQKFLHGGNFHGEYIAANMDELKASIVKLTMLLERQINFFLNRKLNRTFPYFLNLKQPGLTLALQGLQFVATSATADSQSLGFPHRLHSIPTNGDNQDVVSMGTDAALFTAKVIDNAYMVLAIELVTLAQAADCFGSLSKFSTSSRKLYQFVRKIVPKIVADRVFYQELDQLVKHLKTVSDFTQI